MLLAAPLPPRRPPLVVHALVEQALGELGRLADRARGRLDADPAAARADADRLVHRATDVLAQVREVVGQLEPGAAGDVHDVLGHGLTLAAVLAGAAVAALPADARRGGVALDQAAGVLHDARAEVRALVDAEGASGPCDGRDALDLARLVGWAVAAGERVELHADWAVLAAAPGPVVDAAYRILQEALTNARKHAAGAPVAVRAWPDAGALVVEVVTGPGETLGVRGAGHGLAFMRRRATALGGALTAVAPRGGGFAVRAVLPLGAAGPQAARRGPLPHSRDARRAR